MRAEVLRCELPGVGPVTVRIRPIAINLLVGEEQPSFSFDLAGRLIGAFVDGANYRRGLDGRVLRKWSGAHGRERAWLPPQQAADLVSGAYRLAEAAAEALSDERLDVLRGWTPERFEADAGEFARIYRPISILPPDQYLALVIQATEGCSYNRCTFCDFYRDRPFRIKGPEALRAHIREVRRFFGPAFALRKSVFLADANALVAPMPRVRAWLDELDRAQVHRPGGLFSFIDAFDAGRKSVEEWQELAGRGLRRVYIGMESGDDALLRFLRKPGAASDIVEAVRLLKAAGVAVSTIVMTGAGGQPYAQGHVENTVAALRAMPLGRGDIVYLSPFFEPAGAEYGALARAAGVTPLEPEAVERQGERIREAILATKGKDGVQVSRYDIREFVY